MSEASVTFLMVNDKDSISAVEGASVTVRMTDFYGAHGPPCANPVFELGNGLYRLNLSHIELNSPYPLITASAPNAMRTFIDITKYQKRKRPLWFWEAA